MSPFPRPLRVLIMDDEEYRVDSFRAFLPGTEIRWAKSAAEAKFLLKNNHFDAVFLDHDLELSTAYHAVLEPGNGTEVVDWLVRLGRHRWRDTLFVVHSINHERGRWMAHALAGSQFITCRRAYAWMDSDDLRALAETWSWSVLDERFSTAWPVAPKERVRSLIPRRHQQFGGVHVPDRESLLS